MSLKNKTAKPANEVKKEGLTIEQHLNNILFALQHGSLTISNAERNAVYSSYNHIHSLLTKKEEK
jgi:hypothetical protein